ncbi:MAG TPA: wax ester/triacylglycerol synthase family O-acyltransferase [Propionibacteriaceae bacterium]
MQQLTALDAWFISESDTQFQHICDIMIFDAEGPGLTLAELRSVVEQRLHLLGPLRRRLVEVPFGIDEPYWVEDPDFDLANHLYEESLPAPGGDRELADVTARIAGRRLDRSRPLWELHLIHGLEGGRTALIKKFHHAAVDGASGLEITGVLLDPTPELREVPPPTEEWRPDPVPSESDMLMLGFKGAARRPMRMLEVQKRLLRNLPEPGEAIRSPTGDQSIDGGFLSAPEREVPPTPWNQKISAERMVAFGPVALGDVKDVKNKFGVTLNDVVVAVCAGAVRRWLQERDALPAEPLLVCVPISVRTEEEKTKLGNRVSILVAEFPTHLATPLERVRAAHEAMKVAKEEHNAMGANLMGDLGELMMPALQARASRVTASMDLPEEKPRHNLSISNLPGSRVPLYLAGHRLQAHYPIGMVQERQGLMITIASYLNSIGFGLVSEPNLVPDLWHVLDMIKDELQQLMDQPAESATEPTAVKDQSAGAAGQPAIS